jgi:hypothetical protein
MKKLIFTLTPLLSIGSANAQKAYITGFSGMSITDPANIQIQDTLCCGRMVYVTKSFDSNRVYVTHWNANRLYYVSGSSDMITDSMEIQVWDVVSDNESDKLFASQTVNNAVYIINPVAKTYDSIIVQEPNMLEKRPGHKEIWVTNNKQFSVIDYTATPTVSNYTIDAGGTLGRDEVRFTADGNTALVVHSLDGKVYKIDANTKAKTDSVTLGNLFGVEVSADGSKFYASSPLNNKIYMYNLATMALTDSILTQRNPFTMYVNPYSPDQLWVIDHNQDTLTIFNTGNKSAVDSTGITSGPYYVVFMKQGPGAVHDVAGSNTVSFYPNPVREVLHLQQKMETVNVYDMTGRLQYSDKRCSDINVAAWPKGLYILQVTDKGRVSYGKFLKE